MLVQMMNVTIFLCIFFFWATSFNFFPSRVDPSRNSATLIDNIFTSHSPNLKFSSGLVFTDLSDHFPIYLSLSVPKTEITVDEKGKSS